MTYPLGTRGCCAPLSTPGRDDPQLSEPEPEKVSLPEIVLEPEWGELVKNSPVSSDTGDTGSGWQQSVLESRSGRVSLARPHRRGWSPARSISQIYSLSVASSLKFQALNLSMGHTPHRQHNRLLLMKTHSFLNESILFIVHSFLVKMSIVGLSEWAEY